MCEDGIYIEDIYEERLQKEREWFARSKVTAKPDTASKGKAQVKRVVRHSSRRG